MNARDFPSSFVTAPKRVDTGQVTVSEIVSMAWDDQTSFDDIKAQTGLPEADVIKVMRANMKPSSFRLWRRRVSGRSSKHGVND